MLASPMISVCTSPEHCLIYDSYALLAVAMTEETFGVAHQATNALVEFSVDLIVDYLVDLSVNHLIDHRATGNGYTSLNCVQALVDEIVGSGINGCIRGEIAGFLDEIRILVLIGHIQYSFCL
jgi:hypothetical protein